MRDWTDFTKKSFISSTWGFTARGGKQCFFYTPKKSSNIYIASLLPLYEPKRSSFNSSLKKIYEREQAGGGRNSNSRIEWRKKKKGIREGKEEETEKGGRKRQRGKEELSFWERGKKNEINQQSAKTGITHGGLGWTARLDLKACHRTKHVSDGYCLWTE